MNEKMNVEGTDKIEELLMVMMESKESIEPILDMLISIAKSGAVEKFSRILGDLSASDPSYLVGIFSSEESMRGLAKLLGLFSSLLAAAGSETMTDIIKALSFNSDAISESMVTGAKNPERFGLMKLMSMLKDPDFASGMTAIINAIKVVGKLLKDIEK